MNPVEVNRIIFNLTTKIQNNLILIEKGKIKELDFYNDLKNEYNVSLEELIIKYQNRMNLVRR